MADVDLDVETDEHRTLWGVLDDASQVLVRAESLVMLLQCAQDVEEHHRYGAGLAWELLRNLKDKLNEAQDLARKSKREGVASTA